jgi:septum formation protein
MKIYLASKSPRRQELLSLMGIEYELLITEIPEVVGEHESPHDYSMRITSEKSLASYQKMIEQDLTVRPILCADTEVVLDSIIYGKPRDYQHAFEMLKSYSGRSHQVITCVGLQYHNFQKFTLVETCVSFARMTDSDIHSYLALKDYQDKAGGYAIQSNIAQFISGIQGCFYSVMGLPLNAVRELMHDLNIWLA